MNTQLLTLLNPELHTAGHERRQRREIIIGDGTAPEILELLQAAEVPACAIGQAASAKQVLQAITTVLGGEQFDTVHIVAHGRPGAFSIGGQWVDERAVRESASLLGQWGAGQVALWSCEVGADEAFVSTLGRLAKAHVDATSGLLGSVEGRANWSLQGGITPPIARGSLKSWEHTLARLALSGTVYQVTSVVDKETNSHTFSTAGLAASFVIEDAQSSRLFSGNDVVAKITFGATTVFGWISRPIKVGGEVVGFYFWKDNSFTDFTSATDANNTDADANPGDNTGYILVVPGKESFFSSGTRGSSSDRVDNALNALIGPNVAPLAINDSLTVTEDVPANGNVLTNDIDPNGDTPLTVAAFTIAGQSGPFQVGTAYNITNVGSFTLNGNGAYTFAPASNYNGAVPLVTYTVTDPYGATATATLTLTVTPVNDGPAASPDTKTVTEDTPASGNVLANDSDIDGGPLTVTSFSIASQPGPFTIGTPYTISGVGTFTLNANGSYVFVPALNYTGSVPVVSYTASDGALTSSSTLTLTMSAVNDAPVALADNADGTSFARAEDCAAGTQATAQTGNVLTNDTDPDGAVVGGTTHAVSSVRSELGAGATWDGTTVTTVVGRYGTLTINPNGSYSYAIDGSNTSVQALTSAQSLTETFSYTMTESSGGSPLSSSSTLKIVVKGNNDEPVARDDADSVNELAASTTTNSITNFGTATAALPGVLSNDTDPDGDSLTVTTVATSGSASAQFQTGASVTSLTLAFDSTPSQLSTSYYIYYLDTGLGDPSPVLLYTDLAKTTLLQPATVTGSGSNRNLTLSTSTVYFDDGSGGTTSRTLTTTDVLGFDDVTSNPSGANYYLATINSATSTSSASFTNVSGPVGTIAEGMTIAYSSGETTFSGIVGPVTYDGNGAVTSFTVASPSGNLVSGTTYTISLSETENAGTSIKGQYGFLDLAANGSYTYYLTSSALPPGTQFTERFTYTATDGNCTDTAVLSILLTGTQVVLADTTDAGSEDTQNTGSVAVGGSTVASATWNGAALTLGSPTTITGVGTLTLNAGGTYTFDPALNYTGPVPAVTYTTATGGTATLTLTITPVNDAPVAGDDAKTVTEDLAATGNLLGNDTDVEGDALSVTEYTIAGIVGTQSVNSDVSIPDVGTIRLNSDGSYTFTPASNYSGSVPVITYTVSDGNGGTDTADLTLTMAPVNDAPVNALPSAPTTNSYTAFSFTGGSAISVSDPDGNEAGRRIDTVVLTVTAGTLAVTGGTGVTVSGDGTGTITLTRTGTEADLNAVLASLVYTPTTSKFGSDALTITTTDAGGLTDIDSLPITVSADNRSLTVTGSSVNEASSYVMFSVAGAAGQYAKLDLSSGTATSGTDFVPSLEYYDGSAWVAYAPGAYIALPFATTYVRVPVLQDTIYEGSETLTLTATNQAGAGGANRTGNSTIRDDGLGDVYLDGATNLTPSTGPGGGYPANLDDDRPLTVTSVSDPAITSIRVNEASPYAVLKVNGAAGQLVSLETVLGTAESSDFDPETANTGTTGVEYLDGSTWMPYVAGSFVPLGAGGLLVRVGINLDTPYEGPESLGLIARNTGGSGAQGTIVIYDDGTGDIYPDTPDGSKDLDGPFANHLVVDVAALAPQVNENSAYAMFSVTATPGENLALAVSAPEGEADTSGFGIQFSYDGTTWFDYDTQNQPVAPGGGLFYVRVDILSERDGDLEVSEAFALSASISTGAGATDEDTVNIVDEGNGDLFTGDVIGGEPEPDPETTPDDDRAPPPSDTEPPVVEPDQSISYLENRSAGISVGRIKATDNVRVTDFLFDGGLEDGRLSPDGFYRISSNGVISLTDAGAAAGRATNDFETTPNAFSYDVVALDALGNRSEPESITLNVLDLDDVKPVIDPDQVIVYVEDRKAGAVLGTVTSSDNVGVIGYRFASSGTTVSADGYYRISASGLIALTSAGAAAGMATNDFDITPNDFLYDIQARDAAGNWSDPVSVSLRVTDVDDTAPVMAAGQVIPYPENRTAGTALGTVAATDNVAVIGFRFASTGTNVSPDGYYQISAAGVISLTAAGAAAAVASNDFETAPNSFEHLIQAGDGAGNWSAPALVTLRVTDVDDTAPSIAAGQVIPYPENRTAGTTLGTVAATDNVAVTGFRFASTGTNVSPDGYYQISAAGVISLTAAGAAAAVASNDFETAPNSFEHLIQARDAAGNWSEPALVSLRVTNLDETPPLITGPSNGPGAQASEIVIDENNKSVTTLLANEPVTWSIAGGEDGPKFAIDPASGALTFLAAPDFEAPTDGATSGPNSYIVQVRATDAVGNESFQTVTVRIRDVNEFGADLDPASDTGARDRVTQEIEPEFTVIGGSFLQEGRVVQLVDPQGRVVGSVVVDAAAAASGKINVAPGELDDGSYTFTSRVVDAAGNVIVSAPVLVTVVTDLDGVAPSVEQSANNGDFNKDGVPDWQQNNVTHLPVTSLAAYQQGSAAPDSSFGAVMVGNPSAAAPGGVNLDPGAQLQDVKIGAAPAIPPGSSILQTPMFDFQVTSLDGSALADINPGRAGLQTQVVIDLPQGVRANAYLKFNDVTRTWFDYTNQAALNGSVDGAALLDRNGDGLIDRVVLTLTDGGIGDEDGVANGTIVDPGALALTVLPVYRVNLDSGDRFLSPSQTFAAAKSAQPEGDGKAPVVEFYVLPAATADTVSLKAYVNTLTGDYVYLPEGVAAPYACYVPTDFGGTAFAPKVGKGAYDVHLYLNAEGLTQLMSVAQATTAGLLSQGYTDLGAVFASAQGPAPTGAEDVGLVGVAPVGPGFGG